MKDYHMHSILFVLEKVETTEPNKINKWQDALRNIPGISTPVYSNGVCPERILLIHDGNDLPLLARAIGAAEDNLLSYKLVFNGDAGEWKRMP